MFFVSYLVHRTQTIPSEYGSPLPAGQLTDLRKEQKAESIKPPTNITFKSTFEYYVQILHFYNFKEW